MNHKFFASLYVFERTKAEEVVGWTQPLPRLVFLRTITHESYNKLTEAPRWSQWTEEQRCDLAHKPSPRCPGDRGGRQSPFMYLLFVGGRKAQKTVMFEPW